MIVKYIKLFITFCLLFLVFQFINFEDLESKLHNANIPLLIIAFLSHIIAFLLLSFRWWYLVKINSNSFNYRDIAGSYYLGLFCNNFLPTGFGGDIVRIIRLRRKGLSTSSLISSTFVDRVIGLYTIILFGLCALLFSPVSLVSTSVIQLITITVVIAPVVLKFTNYKTIQKLFQSLFQNKNNQRIKKITEIGAAIFAYQSNTRIIAIAILLSVISQLFVILTYIFIGISVEFDFEFTNYFIIVPIVFLASNLPISVGGHGIREGTMLFLFSTLSTDTQSIITLSVIYLSIVILLTLPGGLILLRPHSNNEQNRNLKGKLLSNQ